MTQENDQKQDSQKQDNQEKTEQQQKPQGLFRVSGLAAFVGTIGVIGIGGFLFADSIAKFAMTKAMETTFGAQTDIENVEVNWSPFGITVGGLAQTDAAKPSHNLFELDTLQAQVDLWQMLLGQYVVDKAKFERLAFDRERSSNGEVFERLALFNDQGNTQRKTKSSGSEALGISVPTADDLLARLDLQTEVKGRAFEQTWQQEKPKLEQAFKQLPDKNVLAELKKDWKRLSSMELKTLEDANKLKQELSALKKKVDDQKQAFDLAKSQYKESKTKLDKAYSELEQAAKDDWSKVESQVSLTDSNAVALSKLLFGPEVANYVETAQTYWHKAKPYIDNYSANKAIEEEVQPTWAGDKDIVYPLNEQWPDWIVKELEASVLLSNKLYEVSASELNLQSYIRNKPSLYEVKLAEEFRLTGQYFVSQQAQIETQGQWRAKEVKVNEQVLSDSKELAISLNSAQLSGNGDYSYKEKINSNSRFNLTNTDFSGQGSSKIAKLTLETLEQVQSFNVDLGISGEPQSPSISVRSDLDSQVGKAFSTAFNKEWRIVKADTKVKLENKLKAQFGMDDTNMAELQSLLSGMDKDFSGMAGSSVEDIIKQRKKAYEDKLKNKAKDKLKDKLKSFLGG